MATYFHESHEIQPESIQTLYLMNPNFTTLSQPQHLVGIPIQSAIPTQDSTHCGLWTHLSGSNHQGLSLSLPMPEIATQAMPESALVNSKYLKFAQQLLEEMVGVGQGIRDGLLKRVDAKSQVKLNGDGDHVDENVKQTVELTIAERQELQMKKAKLVNLLDEVGKRFRQYHQQMQLVVSSFESAAGMGSAKTYTALAQQTISRKFRCLQDAITGQIQVTAKSLGDEEFARGGTKSRGSNLQFIDQQVRQQRALQQLGMIQHNAWRPQRGLPERSVSVLRSWLFEHFLHPYPKDSDKQMLAKQTGLTRSQVSNWFINARVRLWKPMVEEMYKEEIKEQEQSNINERTSETDANDDSSSKSNAQQETPTRTDQTYPQPPQASYGEDDNLFIQSKLKKARSEESMNREVENHGYLNYGGGFGEYSVGEIERFGIEQFGPALSGNGVSLTLGLTQYGNLSLSGAQASYLSSNNIENNGFSVAHPSNAYEDISIESRKRFAAHSYYQTL